MSFSSVFLALIAIPREVAWCYAVSAFVWLIGLCVIFLVRGGGRGAAVGRSRGAVTVSGLVRPPGPAAGRRRPRRGSSIRPHGASLRAGAR